MSSFEDKKKLLFECLNSAEQCIKGTSLEQRHADRHEPSQRNQSHGITKRFHGRESIFKRPEAPISKCLRPRRAPDYQTNPHKWKKYSLDDADISDRTNASAAFAFLAEMEKRKDIEEETRSTNDAMDTDDSSSGKIVFKKRDPKEIRKPSFNKSVTVRKQIEPYDEVDESIDKPILKGSKVVMPEYVIGQKKTNKTKRKSNSDSPSDSKGKKLDGKNKPLLQHLFDQDEEQEEEGEEED